MSDNPQERAFTTAMAFAAALVAYFAAPLIGYMNASLLATFGFPLAAGVTGSWLTLHFGWNRRWDVVSNLAIVFGFIGLIWQVTAAQSRYNDNLRRCLEIEQDMLSLAPRRSDGPELFQALGCHPQSGADLRFPAAKPAGR